MHNMRFLALFLLLIGFNSPAKQKQIALEDIWNGTFRTERMDVLHSMQNGKQYSVLNFERETSTTSADVNYYETLTKHNTLIDSRNLDGIRYFIGYTFIQDEAKLLYATEFQSIYRRSTLGDKIEQPSENQEVKIRG